jgi:hypothetical protein
VTKATRTSYKHTRSCLQVTTQARPPITQAVKPVPQSKKVPQRFTYNPPDLHSLPSSTNPSRNQGIGEAIRGNINAFADSATGTDSTKSRNVAERGELEFETGKYAGTGAGVTPHDTDRERVNRNLQGEGAAFSHPTTTGASTTAAPAAGGANPGPPLPERRV